MRPMGSCVRQPDSSNDRLGRDEGRRELGRSERRKQSPNEEAGFPFFAVEAALICYRLGRRCTGIRTRSLTASLNSCLVRR